jgi:citrate lyase subunit beta/citryl-CoA lyase
MLIRSLLFAPANRLDFAAKLADSGADCVVLDLEDSIPAAERPAARLQLAEAVALARGTAERESVYVRVNAADAADFALDMAAVRTTAADGIVLPKATDTGDVLAAAVAFGKGGKVGGGGEIIVGIESLRGVVNAVAIAGASPAIRAVYFGAEDYAAELGARRTPEGIEVLYARSQVVLAAKLARVGALDQVVTQFRDEDLFRLDAEQGRNLGYDGKICIHPGQVALANSIFAPTPAEVERAERLIAAYEAAGRSGQGSLDFEGQMIDEPLIRTARALIAAAGRG